MVGVAEARYNSILRWLRRPNMDGIPVRESGIGEEILHKDVFIEQSLGCHLNQLFFGNDICINGLKEQ